MAYLRQDKQPTTISKPLQLIVEGHSTEIFFTALLRQIGMIDNIQIHDFGGKNELSRFLGALRSVSGFDIVTAIGIIRDADDNPKGAFQSVCSALQKSGLSQPRQPETFNDNTPRVGVFILPGGNKHGMLETLCLRSISSDPVMKCIDEYFNCIQKQNCSLPRIIDKARVQAFLASRSETIWLLGEAAQGGYWQWDSPALDPVKRFLNLLM